MKTRRTRKPVFARLTAAESKALLRRNHVGRIAFVNQGVVDIEPVHFVTSTSWLLMRSAEGTKLEAFAHSPYVAFEVDEVEGPFDWRSVVVHGTIYFIDPERGETDRALQEEAVRHLRTIDADMLTADDSAPHRQQLLRIYVDEVTARSARPA